MYRELSTGGEQVEQRQRKPSVAWPCQARLKKHFGSKFGRPWLNSLWKILEKTSASVCSTMCVSAILRRSSMGCELRCQEDGLSYQQVNQGRCLLQNKSALLAHSVHGKVLDFHKGKHFSHYSGNLRPFWFKLYISTFVRSLDMEKYFSMAEKIHCIPMNIRLNDGNAGDLESTGASRRTRSCSVPADAHHENCLPQISRFNCSYAKSPNF